MLSYHQLSRAEILWYGSMSERCHQAVVTTLENSRCTVHILKDELGSVEMADCGSQLTGRVIMAMICNAAVATHSVQTFSQREDTD